jgi:hypothetical protein
MIADGDMRHGYLLKNFWLFLFLAFDVIVNALLDHVTSQQPSLFLIG